MNKIAIKILIQKEVYNISYDNLKIIKHIDWTNKANTRTYHATYYMISNKTENLTQIKDSLARDTFFETYMFNHMSFYSNYNEKLNNFEETKSQLQDDYSNVYKKASEETQLFMNKETKMKEEDDIKMSEYTKYSNKATEEYGMIYKIWKTNEELEYKNIYCINFKNRNKQDIIITEEEYNEIKDKLDKKLKTIKSEITISGKPLIETKW